MAHDTSKKTWNFSKFFRLVMIMDSQTICYKVGGRAISVAVRKPTFTPHGSLHSSESGFLAKADSSRGGNRRYYTIPDSARIEVLLQKCVAPN